MSVNESKLYTFKEREWVVTGWAEGQMETEREDDKGQKVIVMQPYYQLFVISPVSSYKSDNYSANGMKAEKLRCVSNAVWKDLTILGNTSTLATLVGDVWDIMTANPILTLFICAGLVTLGFSIFRKAKRAARG